YILLYLETPQPCFKMLIFSHGSQMALGSSKLLRSAKTTGQSRTSIACSMLRPSISTSCAFYEVALTHNSVWRRARPTRYASASKGDSSDGDSNLRIFGVSAVYF